MDRFGSLFHVVVSDASEIAFQLDGHSTKTYLYLQHENVFILLWELAMDASSLDDHRIQYWYERNLPFFVSLFCAAFFLLLLLSNVRLSRIAEQCDDEVCNAYSDDRLYPKNLRVREGVWHSP